MPSTLALVFLVAVAHPAPSLHVAAPEPRVQPIALRQQHVTAIPNQFPWRGLIYTPIYILPPEPLCLAGDYWGPWGLLTGAQPFGIYSAEEFGSSMYGGPWSAGLPAGGCFL